MFLKKKPAPVIDPGAGDSLKPAATAVAVAADGPSATTTSPSSSRDPNAVFQQWPTPMSPPPTHAFDIPTLHRPSTPQSARSPPLGVRNFSRTIRHGRSVSQPFSAHVDNDAGGENPVPSRPADIKVGDGRSGGSGGGGGRDDNNTGRDGKRSGTKFSFFSNSLPKVSTKPQPTEPDFVTGRCATCDSTVRWPRHLDVFRCTLCMMVNDMQYGTLKDSQSPTGPQQSPRFPRKVQPVSVDRTKSMISQCTHAFLRRKVDELQRGRRAPLDPPMSPIENRGRVPGSPVPRPNPYLDVAAPSRNDSRSTSRGPPPGNDGDHDVGGKRSFDGRDRPRTAPGQPRTSDEMTSFQPRYIYRHFENYLLSCMNDCDSLNASFMIARPPPPIRASSEMTAAQHESQKKIDNLEATDGFLGELDAKMLLLGDIGENARYWLGDGSDALNDNVEKGAMPPPPSKKKPQMPVIEKRQPRFNWRQLWEWYQSILFCGRNWRSMRASFNEDERQCLMLPKVEREIDIMLTEARNHVQRTLLKATENLLRHPGRPVKRPEDSRFLLILLSNPMLHPQHSHHANVWSPEQILEVSKSPTSPSPDQTARMAEHAKIKAEAASNGSATGHHSGIIKRLMGLIGNLSDDCHLVIISWLHRIPVPQLRDLVELVGGFVSYRLTRNAGRARASSVDPTNGLIPMLSPAGGSGAQLHAAIGEVAAKQSKKKDKKDKPKENAYADDWQVKAAAKVMSLLFFANFGHVRARQQLAEDAAVAQHNPRNKSIRPGQALPLSEYYNVLLDDSDIIADFDQWEQKRNKFSFCQYPMFFSIWSKIRLMEHDARRKMQDKARDAFFNSIMTRKVENQYLIVHVRRECLVEDSLKEISTLVGAGGEELKKALKIEFDREEGIDIGGLRKEWFLLLVREVFDPRHGLFLYDEDSQYCYFNPHTFETSEQYYLVGVVLGLAIYNSTILDISLPPFLFKKLLAAAPPWTGPSIAAPKPQMTYTLDDLAEWRPHLAKGLRQLLEFEGDVESTFCRDFVVDVERYGTTVQVPLMPGGEKRAVTNTNRREFVDLYVRHILDGSVARQFEPFKRGFFAVCSGNALALFRPEEIELLVRGSDDALDVDALMAVAIYDNWEWERHGVDLAAVPNAGRKPTPVPADVATAVPQIRWFWDSLRHADPKDQRRLLGFVTGSDRIPAMGATSLVVKVAYLGDDARRFPIARTCFNTIGLHEYESKEQLELKLWTAVTGSEGFGLK